jgi:hypothetical protein
MDGFGDDGGGGAGPAEVRIEVGASADDATEATEIVDDTHPPPAAPAPETEAAPIRAQRGVRDDGPEAGMRVPYYIVVTVSSISAHPPSRCMEWCALVSLVGCRLVRSR